VDILGESRAAAPTSVPGDTLDLPIESREAAIFESPFTVDDFAHRAATSSLRLGEVVIGALAVVNAAGDILDWRTGKTLAGARRADGKGFARLTETFKQRLAALPPHASLRLDDEPLHSTTLVVLATNVRFDKPQLTKIAMMANCGAARAINPYHTTGDGDQLYALSTRRLHRDVPLSVVGAIAAEVVAEAIDRAVKAAASVEGWPAYRDTKSE
jgi:L-aminopeptidase/D-esterase-like protein